MRKGLAGLRLQHAVARCARDLQPDCNTVGPVEIYLRIITETESFRPLIYFDFYRTRNDFQLFAVVLEGWMCFGERSIVMVFVWWMFLQ